MRWSLIRLVAHKDCRATRCNRHQNQNQNPNSNVVQGQLIFFLIHFFFFVSFSFFLNFVLRTRSCKSRSCCCRFVNRLATLFATLLYILYTFSLLLTQLLATLQLISHNLYYIYLIYNFDILRMNVCATRRDVSNSKRKEKKAKLFFFMLLFF